MEADITPATETNGTAANAREGVENPEQPLQQQQQKAADPVEASVAGAVGEIIDYLEEEGGGGEGAGGRSQDADADAEMGEAEYLDGEMPEEQESEPKDGSKEAAEEEGDEHEEEEEEEEASGDKEKDAEGADEEAASEAADKEETEGGKKADEGEADDEEGEGDDEEAPEGEEEEAAEGEGEAEGEGDFETEEEGEGEGEIITGDEPAAVAEGGAAAESPVRERKKEEPVDENQCRVCTSKEDLVSLFKKHIDATPADMLLVICPSVSILPKDFMPQFICTKCLSSLTIAIQLRKQLESTEQNLRKRLSRSKNKVRRPRGYVVIDAPVTDSSDDDEELNDDAEFKMSDVGGSTSPESDSGDSDESEKKEKKKPGRPRKKPLKRSLDDDEEPSSAQKKKYQGTSTASVGPFECDQCDLTFSRKQSYVLHRKTHERSEHTCQICGKVFKVEWAYKTHVERHEQERAQFRCELCSQVFRLRAELKRHMAVKHDEHGFIYECKRCQRTFLTQQRLQRHQSIGCQRQSDERSSHQRDMGRRDGYSHGNSGKRRSESGHPGQGRDLFKSVAPLTTTYWSDSFSD